MFPSAGTEAAGQEADSAAAVTAADGSSADEPPSTSKLGLQCVGCQREEADLTRSRCRHCGGCLAFVGPVSLPLVTPNSEGVWRFASLLPTVGVASQVSLGEGATPLLASPRLMRELGVELMLKDETRHPTGSFKDRILAVAASVAVDCGAAGLVCASTGNAGASTAAYAARAGLPGLIVAPAGAPTTKVTQARVYGANWIGVDGNYSDAYNLALAASSELGYMNVTTTFVSPFSVEGSKTVTYELYEDLDGRVPDWVVVPIGAGPLLVGIEVAYRQLRSLGLVDQLPRMLAVQPSGCAPIARAFRDGKTEVASWGTPATVVGGLADPLHGYEREGNLTLDAIRRSDGGAVVIDDGTTLSWVHRLATGAGLFAEPSGAISVAAVEQARREGIIQTGESVVCCVTGSGLKEPTSAGIAGATPVIRPTVEQVSSVLANNTGVGR